MNAVPLLYAAQAVLTERITIDRIQASLNNLSSSQTQLAGWHTIIAAHDQYRGHPD